MATNTEPMEGVSFMSKIQSIIPEAKWDDYVTEWNDAEVNYRHNSTDIRYEGDEYVVVVFPHGTNWFDYYECDDIDTRIVMEKKAREISGQKFTNTYPVVLPK